jgi:hypothetical protein
MSAVPRRPCGPVPRRDRSGTWSDPGHRGRETSRVGRDRDLSKSLKGPLDGRRKMGGGYSCQDFLVNVS